jgi:hypothetical protein
MVPDRIRRARRRHRRISGLAGSRTFGTVSHSGVAQEALFGVELSLVNPVEVANLRKAAVRAHGVPIIGTSHKVSLLAMPLVRDSHWIIDCRRQGGLQYGGRTALGSFDTVGIRTGLCPSLTPPALPDGLEGFNGSLPRGITTTHVGVDPGHGLEAWPQRQAGPPALLYRLLKPGARLRQFQEAQFPGAPAEWEAPYLVSVLDPRSQRHALSSRGKKALLAYMAGRYPTWDVLAGWGFMVDIACLIVMPPTQPSIVSFKAPSLAMVRL